MFDHINLLGSSRCLTHVKINSTFYSVCFCDICVSQTKQWFCSPYSTKRSVFITDMQCVYCAAKNSSLMIIHFKFHLHWVNGKYVIVT